ncbi:MAG: NAD(P)H-dependent oxidoreductase [Oscillospiraceae bacterium]|nr:NAD(P)H-dependent oxidoreductase [Oscillospiraceae bacterium]
MILFVDACVRKGSRTRRLACALLQKLGAPVTEVDLTALDFPTVDERYLVERDALIRTGHTDAPMLGYARQFAEADTIVIAAPFWDLSFPAALKRYLELVTAVGVTFRYTEEGIPQGMCRAKKLYYVTTAGGTYFPEEYGYGYVRALCVGFYGISETELIKATGLDIYGADAEEILDKAIEEIRI